MYEVHCTWAGMASQNLPIFGVNFSHMDAYRCSSPASAERFGCCRGCLKAILLLLISEGMRVAIVYTLELVCFSDQSINYISPYLVNGKSV